MTSLHKIELLLIFKVLTEREGKRGRERMSLFGNEYPLKGQYITFHLPTSHSYFKGLQAKHCEASRVKRQETGSFDNILRGTQ